MKTVTMLEFRQNAARLLRRLANGERFILSHRGKPAARLEPVQGAPAGDLTRDPFLTIGQRASASRKGRTKHAELDRILYGRG
jgi:antitoxin (DNA-binding transcriptional repressor) of toxin-antitoxin stability system